ncbi:MAG: hypothetical protein KC561_10985, partial [Myxococcales bacterium]|nr:hypothetical protein [Myxococcales bacterium]
AHRLLEQTDTVTSAALSKRLESCERAFASAITDPSEDRLGLRTDVNALVLATSQILMATSKGRGFLSSHPASRLCRQALFFLVWSAPEPVRESTISRLLALV